MSVPAAPGGTFPLTSAQLGVCLAHHLGSDTATYNLAKYVEILGPVDPDAFEDALVRAGRECGAFDIRIRIDEDGRTPVQELVPTTQTPRFVDLSDETDPVASAEMWMDVDRRAPVDLTGGGLFIDVLFRIGPERHFWYSRCHHILVDGYGDELLTRRVAALYTEAVAGEDPDAVAAALKGSAFEGGPRALVDDEAEYRSSARYGEDRDWWVNRCADLTSVTGLADRAPEEVTGASVRQRALLPAEDFDRLRAAARQGRTTWTVIFAAAVGLYLRSLTGLDEASVGIPVPARRTATLRTPGMLANELPLRVKASPWHTKQELLREVSTGLSDLLRRQHYPLDDLRRELGVDGALFGPTLNMLTFEEPLTFGGHRTVQHRLANGPVRDLNITVSVGAASGVGDGLLIDFDANPTTYTQAQVEAHQRQFLTLLRDLVAADASLSVGRLGVVDAVSRGRLLALGTGAVAAGSASLLDLFAGQVGRTPDAVAVVADGVVWSYRELDERAGRLAAAVGSRLRGVEPVVAILLERSPLTVVSALAVLKAGGVYVPLDHRAPVERHAQILARSGAQLLITDREHASDLPTLDPRQEFPACDVVAAPVLPDQLACLLFTSGSTGEPKGVALTHGGIADLVRDAGFTAAAQRRVLLHASPAFDASLYEMFTPLTLGGAVVVAAPGDVTPEVLRHHIAVHGVTSLLLTAGLFRLIAREDPEALAGLVEIWTGGDVVPAGEVRHLLRSVPGITVVDAYGPTEASVIGTRHAVADPALVPEVMPIGLPLDGMRAYLLDQHLQPAPPETSADLYLAGTGLARGYHGEPAQTALHFHPDPYGPPGSRLYRTGDTARWSEGRLTFTGRTDQQVKIRGYRIEPTEIETALKACADLQQALVLAHTLPTGGKQLVGYLVPAPGTQVDPDALRAELARILPDYMIPAALVTLDTLPLTRNGKVDRTALPTPQQDADRPGRPPADERERLLCALYAEVLELPEVFADDNFFALGGDSIISIQLASRARKEGLALSPRDVFAHKTPEALAVAVPDLADVQELPFAADDPALALDQDELDELEAEWELSQ